MRLFIHYCFAFLAFGFVGESFAADVSCSKDYATYDLWCNQQSDLCTFTDVDGVMYKLGRDYLPDHVPMSPDTSECMLEVCYDDNGDITGLNPDYHLFDE